MVVMVTETVLQRAQLAGLLEQVGAELEWGQEQLDRAKKHYGELGSWLATANDPLIAGADIYVQGSVALGTTVRPLHQEEHDVDLVSHHPRLATLIGPRTLKLAIGRRLQEHRVYGSREVLEEMKRCWRVNLPGEFHIDITPSIHNPECLNGGELVPEKYKPMWKPTNPRGLRKWFDERAALTAQIRLEEAEFAKIRAQVESLPEPARFKGLLRRLVQFAKRHRDVWFSNRNSELSPISIIITTLAAMSYAHCVVHGIYETEFDLLLAVMEFMPAFIERRNEPEGMRYTLWNPTTDGENFAEKWNADPRLADAFDGWHAALLRDFGSLVVLVGIDEIAMHLGRMLGEAPVKRAVQARGWSITSARDAGRLTLSPGTVGLSVGGAGVRVRSHTFHGR